MKLLYVEDSAADADLARRSLARTAPDWELHVVTDLASARRHLEQQTVDAVLCDLRLPDGSGLDLLAWIREHNLPTAVAMVTGSGDQDSALAALKAGADNYLVKNSGYLERLATTVGAARKRFHAERTWRARLVRVLYAEHNGFDQELTQRHFAEHAPHIRLECVPHAEAVLERLPEDPSGRCNYDVLLLDYRLPGLDALELTKTVRAERGLALPVVLVTGQGSEETVALALGLGVSEYVTKHPNYLTELVAVIEKCHHQALMARERAALAETTRQLKHLLEASPVVLYALRLENERLTTVSVSENISRLLGYTVEEALRPGWWWGVLEPAERERLGTLDPALAREGRAVRIYRVRDRHGQRRWIRDEQRLVAGSLDDTAEIVGTWSDITEQQLAQERLQLDDTIFDATRDGVYVTDAAGTIVSVNRALTEITGYSAEELIGRNPRMLQSGRHGPEFYQAMWQSLLRTGRWEGEIWNRRCNSELYPHRLTIRAVCDEQGQVQNYIGVSTDITQVHRYRDQAEHLAHHDPLTDLPNRLLLRSRLEHAVEQAGRHRQQLALLMLDLDRFRGVNDSLGHAAGDELLSRVGDTLRRHLGSRGNLARPSSDEFAVLLEDLETPQQAAGLAIDLLELMDRPLILSAGREVFPRASIGISIYPDDAERADDILRDAYAAVRSAKAAGGGTYRFYTAQMNSEASRTLELETALRRAQLRGELVLHYQPKVELRDGRICAAEALLRWRRADGSLTAPGDFIPLAERTGLIISLGAWVIEEACRQLRAWTDAGLDSLAVAVNVSALQFRDPALEEVIRTALQRHDIAPARLELELTESMLMENPEQAGQRLRSLKALGVGLALDDFGTGYSSLAYLRQFPIDCLKIDRSFVHTMVQDSGAATIAMSIIDLAHRMQLTVVAEGVETDAQLGLLRRRGCDQVQGFLLSEPRPAADFEKLLQAGRALAPPEPGTDEHLLLVGTAQQTADLERLLENQGYRLLRAETPGQALELLARHRVALLLAQHHLPQMQGSELLARVKLQYPDTVRLLLAHPDELTSALREVNRGVLYKILFLPWEPEALLEEIREALEYYQAVVVPRRLRRSEPGSG